MAQARVNLEEHATKMLSELHRMQQEKDHCDFVIKVQNEVYHTHKNVLSAGSEYFRAMLAHDTRESRDGEVTFKDADSDCVKSCIDFIYSGEFQVPTGKIKELLHIGILLRLDGVCSTLAEILIESINAENYYFTTKIADMYELTGVRSKCKQYFEKNLMEIANQPEFGNVPVSKLNKILRAAKLKYSQEEKLTIFLKWAEKNPEDNGVLLESIQRFRLDKMSSAFLRNILKTHPIVSNDLVLYKLISDHLLETLEPRNNISDQNVKHRSVDIQEESSGAAAALMTDTYTYRSGLYMNKKLRQHSQQEEAMRKLRSAQHVPRDEFQLLDRAGREFLADSIYD